jgi:hypothetical protein
MAGMAGSAGSAGLAGVVQTLRTALVQRPWLLQTSGEHDR